MLPSPETGEREAQQTIRACFEASCQCFLLKSSKCQSKERSGQSPANSVASSRSCRLPRKVVDSGHLTPIITYYYGAMEHWHKYLTWSRWQTSVQRSTFGDGAFSKRETTRKTWTLPKVRRTQSLMRISARLTQDYHRVHMAPQHLGGDTQRKLHSNEAPPRYQTFRMVNNLTAKRKRFFFFSFLCFKPTLRLYSSIWQHSSN